MDCAIKVSAVDLRTPYLTRALMISARSSLLIGSIGVTSSFGNGDCWNFFEDDFFCEGFKTERVGGGGS